MAKTMRAQLLTAEEARALFHYDELSGELIRRVTVASNARAGDAIRCKNAGGYRIVRAFGRLYRTSRVIWLMRTGDWPPDGFEIDHRDTDKGNERWLNLRLATPFDNCANVGLQARNTSGFKGVYFNKLRGKWFAQITVRGQWHGLGYHLSPESAHAARAAKAVELQGEFARS